jgi:hypothetical protein
VNSRITLSISIGTQSCLNNSSITFSYSSSSIKSRWLDRQTGRNQLHKEKVNMSTKRTGIKIVAGGLIALVVLLGAAFVLLPAAAAAGALGSRVSRAASQVVAAVTGEPVTLAHFGPGGGGPGFGGHHGEGLAADGTYLAEALDITVEELDAAKEEALGAALEQAVADGLITQAQADDILSNGGGWGWHGLSLTLDMESYLADALGISITELETAKNEAHEAAVNAALEAGTITQEQADYLLAKQAVKSAVDGGSLVAGVLGLTAEEYETARAEGTSLETLIEEAGLTVAEYQTAITEAYEAAVQELVEAGTISQEQADLVLSEGAGLGFGRGFGGRGFGGHGGHGPGGNCPFGGPSQGSNSVTPAADA